MKYEEDEEYKIYEMDGFLDENDSKEDSLITSKMPWHIE